MWPYWQRDRLVADAHGIRESRQVLTIFFAVIGQPRNRMRVVDAGADADRLEAPNDLGALTGQWAVEHHGQTIVAVGLVGGGDIEYRDVLEIGQRVLEGAEIPGATLQDSIQALELFATDR